MVVGPCTQLVILHQNVNAESYVRLLETHNYDSICKETLRRKLSPTSMTMHRPIVLGEPSNTWNRRKIEQLPWPAVAFAPDLNPI